MAESERRRLAAAEAAGWWDRIVRDDLSATDRQAYADWLRESPLHVAEMICVERVHDALETFGNWAGIETDESDDGAASVVDFSERAREVRRTAVPVSASAQSSGHSSRRRTLVRWSAIAASIALAAVGTTTWMLARTTEDTLQTAQAERREATLRDGSVVQMDPDSRLEVRLERHRRLVTLLSGRAVFHVAKNAERPFFVYAGATSVRAVGTTFGVEQRSGDIVVTVAEGRVLVAPPADEPAPSVAAAPAAASTGSGGAGATTRPAVYLDADEQVIVDRGGVAGTVHAVSGNRELAWANGRLFFTDRTVADIVHEFNRYNRLQLQLDAPRLATQTVTGVFDSGDPESFITYLQAGHGAHADRSSAGRITLTD